jgi:uncharacterized phage protein (TIGR01671 family)
MTREIKFRAWDKERKEYLSAGNIFIPVNPRRTPKYNGELFLDTLNFKADNNRFVLEQFTGLKDMNGAPIYEGDIVCHEFHATFPICYRTGDPNDSDGFYKTIGHVTITPSCGVTLNGHRYFTSEAEGEESVKKYNGNPMRWSDCAEVIGNIHENKNLLEANKKCEK